MKTNINFEDALKKLESIVKLLEDGNIGLDDSIKLYEEGILLSDKCTHMLQNAKQKIEIIKNNNYEKSEFDSYTEEHNEF